MVMDQFHLYATLAVILIALIAFASNIFSIEMVSLGTLAALLLLFVVFPYKDIQGELMTPARLLAGFASPELVTVLALLVIGKGLFMTDALNGLTSRLGEADSKRAKLVVMAILVTVGTTSAFLNNTPVVVIFIPILASVTTLHRLPPRQVFMSLSFITILGGMTTTIGSSTNMIAAGMAERQGVHIGLFDISGMGSILAILGAIYVLFVMPRILGDTEAEQSSDASGNGGLFLGEITLKANSRFVGMKPVSGFFPDLAPLTLHSLVREGVTLLPPYEDGLVLAEGDQLQLNGTRRAFMELIVTRETETQQPADQDTQPGIGKTAHYQLAEAVVAPGSRFDGRTIRYCGIQLQFNVTVVGIRRKRRMARGPIDRLRLEIGDTLLLSGTDEAIRSMRGDHNILLLEHSTEPVPIREKALTACAIFAGIILLSAFGISPIVVNALIGAILMIATGCLTLPQAVRAFDRQIYLLIGTSLAMALALEASGGAALIAREAIAISGENSPALAISILFLTVALLTNVLSNNAAAALFMPIALDMAHRLHAPQAAFVAAVIYAANCAFVTPIGYQTNMLVMGPGNYSFRDFAKAGAPLLAIMAIAFSALAPWYYGL